MTFRRLAAVTAVFLLVVGACGTESGTVSTTSSTTTTFGGTSSTTDTTVPADLKPVGGTLEYFFNFFDAINPFLGRGRVNDGNEDMGVLWPLLFAGTFREDAATGDLVPDLITQVPSAANGGLVENPDGTLTVTYEIHPDAVWSDGVPITGSDFAFTHEFVTDLDRLLAEAGVAGTSLVCEQPTPYNALTGGTHAPIDPDSFVVGPKSFSYTLTNPGGYTSDLFWTIVPKHAVEDSDYLRDWIDAAWPSAGPFVVTSIDRAAREVVLDRNPNFWRVDPDTGQALPHLDRIVLTPMTDEVLAILPAGFHDAYAVATGFCDRGAVIEALGADVESEAGAAAFDEFQVALAAVDVELMRRGRLLELPFATAVLGQGGFFKGDAPVAVADVDGVEVFSVRTREWEHIAFQFGDARLRRNPDSLIEHIEFRRAIAHALDRDRIVEEVKAVHPAAGDHAMASVIDTYSPTLAGEGWNRYGFDPDQARVLLASLCDRLGRDCEADPPVLAFTESIARPGESGTIARLLTEMLGDVGIEVDLDVNDLFSVPGCPGWEAADFGWIGSAGWTALSGLYFLWDPAGPAFFYAPDGNLYTWGTDTFVSEGFDDDPSTEDCDESTIFDTGPSSVRNEFTQRYDDLLRRVEATVDPGRHRELVLELDDILADQVVFIPLYVAENAVAVRSDILGGFGYEVGGGVNPPTFWNVDRWYLKQPQPGA